MTRIRFHRMVRLITRRTYGSPIHYETGVAPMAGWLDGLPSPVTRPTPPSCAKPTSGPSTAPSPRHPGSRCTATPTRPTSCWSERKVEQVFDSLDLARSPVGSGAVSGSSHCCQSNRCPVKLDPELEAREETENVRLLVVTGGGV